jgi:hypothetical protein
VTRQSTASIIARPLRILGTNFFFDWNTRMQRRRRTSETGEWVVVSGWW